MSALLDNIAIGMEMLDVRDTMRRLAAYGDKPWPEEVRPIMAVIQKKSEETGEAVLKIAARGAKNATKAGKPGVGMAFVAAAVELLDPTQGTTP